VDYTAAFLLANINVILRSIFQFIAVVMCSGMSCFIAPDYDICVYSVTTGSFRTADISSALYASVILPSLGTCCVFFGVSCTADIVSRAPSWSLRNEVWILMGEAVNDASRPFL
jgi:hypothetical protein